MFKNNKIDKDASEKDRFFFHDLINHTHGLLLYLTQKELSKESMDQSEIRELSNEIKMMQSLIKNHFELNHKNLNNQDELIDQDQLVKMITFFAKVYLLGREVDLNITTTDKILFFKKAETIRVLLNVIKNISESKSKIIQMKINFCKNGLDFKTKNILGINECVDISDYMEQVILNESIQKNEGLGINSIDSLISQLEGEFNFTVTDGFWINEIFIPEIISDEFKNKKAA